MHILSIVNREKNLDSMYIPSPLICDPIMRIWLMKEAYEAFYEMNRGMQKQGLSAMYALRGYQCFAYQKKLFLNEVQKNIRKGQSSDKAYESAMKVLMPPGCSEHQLGFSVDIAFHHIQEEKSVFMYEESKQFAWLKEHAKSYGFILRYPEDKIAYTKVSYRPWHYRYVGIGHAKKMDKLSLCLEEYYEAFYKD